jgi:transposase-like protein
MSKINEQNREVYRAITEGDKSLLQLYLDTKRELDELKKTLKD